MYIQKLDDGSVLLTAPVMIPGIPDCDYQRGEPPLTKEQIHNFKESYEPYRFVDDEHELVITGRVRGYKKESFLLNEPVTTNTIDGSTMTYPIGTWMMTSHITDPEAIIKAEKGDYTGYSPSVRSKDTADKYLELIRELEIEKAEALKSQSLSGLIKDVPNPVVLSVSLVAKPCQTGSKICKIKKDGVNMTEEVKFKTKVLEAMGLSDVADVEALKSQVSDIDGKLEELRKDNEEALKSMKEEILSDFKTMFQEFADKSKKDDDESNDEDSDSEEDESDEQNNNSSEPEEEDDEKNKKKNKAQSDKGSKQGHVHNGADKSQESDDTYEFMGRYPDGTRKSYEY